MSYDSVLGRVRLWWRLRRTNVFLNAWALAIGTLAVIQAVQYLLDPSALLTQSSLGLALQDWAYVWNVLYLAAGACIVYGIMAPSRQVDVVGLGLMIIALLVNTTAILFVRASGAGAVVPTFVAVVVAASLRIWFLVTNGDFLPREIQPGRAEDRHPRLTERHE